ncbi:hypothetical protein IV203_025823 [Nitzschia inconspicua]|uniref:Uncharacterized protein n=1 Tax=Nitzschia inconspicua TaxID=303405 RepID=A0A9K3PWA8_9STRA|nr:hypothetical protein IV203_017670 [Nitzschia inconspicua]KAG7362157.1 hypothetical protein IV203_025823 [Nitzschia inconspicua]
MEDPISIKKLASEGTWSTTKEVLGWLLNGQQRTVSITNQKFQKVTSQISTLSQRGRVLMKDLVKLQGKLKLVIQCYRYWQTTPWGIGYDWHLLIQQLHARPISVHELLPASKPAYQGWADASTSSGAGGVWFGAAQPLLPIVWSLKWPPDIIQAIQQSHLSINTLELFTILAHHLVLEAAVPTATLHHASVAIWCDNTTAVAWANKLRSSSCNFAHRILRLLTPLAMESLLQLNLNDSVFGRIGKTSSKTLSQCTSPSFQTTHCLPDLICWEPSLHLFGLANTNQQKSKSPPKQSYWHAISQTHMLDGQPDPLADEKGQRHIILKRQIENYRRHDPPPKQKLAFPHIAIKYLNVTRADTNPRYQAIHNLCTIAWIYLLHVGEYT